MKKNIIALALAAFACSTNSFAQDLESGYFNDNYLYRHDMNPAIGNEKGYIALPVLGGINVGLRGNLNLTDILYNVDGRTCLFLNPKVSTEEVKKNISDCNKFIVDSKIRLLGIGFKAFKGYNTIDLNLRANGGATMPGDFLIAAKEGLTNDTYDLKTLGANLDVYGELAVGHSHQINENLRIGAKAKVILPIARAYMNIKEGDITLGEDSYRATMDAEVVGCVKDLTYTVGTYENTGNKYVDDIDSYKLGINGLGLAFDLGAEYKWKDWDFSFAIKDLGFVNYKQSYTMSTNGKKEFNTGKYIFNIDDDADNSITNELEKMGDDISEFIQFETVDNTGSLMKGLGTTLTFGAKYTTPFYRKMSVGLSNSTRIQGNYSWTDFRLGLNIRPISFFSLSANVHTGTFGFGFGWMLDLQAKKGFDLFVGMDTTPTKLAKQGVPLKSSMNFTCGLCFPF